MIDNYLLYDPAAFGALEIKEDTREAEILRLRAENEKLRAALKPFSRLAKYYDTERDEDYVWDDEFPVKIGWLRSAADALKETGE